jgi:hypothetical protein
MHGYKYLVILNHNQYTADQRTKCELGKKG